MNANRAGLPRRMTAGLALAVTTFWSPVPLAAVEAPSVGVAEELTRSGVEALNAAGKYDEAEALARRLLAAAERDHGPASIEAAGAIEPLVVALLMQGKASADETLTLAERVLAIRRDLLGADHPAVASSVNQLGSLRHDRGDHAAARALYEEALAIRRRVLPPDDPDTAVSLNNLATLLQDLGDHAAARRLFEEALSSRRRSLPPGHPDVAQALHNLGLVIQAQGELHTARPHLEEALAIYKTALGANHPTVATALNALGSLVHDAGDHATARALYTEALDVRRKALGPKHPDLAKILNNLATVSAAAGDYATALRTYEEALAIRREALGAQHAAVATGLNNLAMVYLETGDLVSARPLFEEALAIWKTRLGPDHPSVASGLNNLAGLLQQSGDLAAARPLWEEALAMRRRSLGPDHPDVATSLNNLATLLQVTGDHAAAQLLVEEALATWKKALGPAHPHVAQSLNNLAVLRHAQGDLESATRHGEEALALRRAALGEDHPAVAESLVMLAGLRQATGDMAAARTMQEQALAIRKKALGPVHPAVARSSSSLAALHRMSGDLGAAQPLVEDALAIRRGALGPNHADVAASLNELASLLGAGGRRTDALALALEAESIGRDHFELTAQALSEREALRFARARPGGLDMALSLVASAPRDAVAVTSAWEAGLRSRALVVDAMAARRRAFRGEPEVRALADRLARTRQRLANLWVRGPGRLPLERWRTLVDEARLEKEGAERELAGASAAYRGDLEVRRATLEDVAASLPRDTALVGYFRHSRWPVGTPERAALGTPVNAYLAFALGAGTREPVAVPLGDAAEMERLVTRWRDAIVGSNREGGDVVRAAGTALREMAWDPVARHLGDARRVVVVPDGALHLVSFAALPAGEGAWVLESGPTIHQVSAERDLLRRSGRDGSGRGLLAVGGPAYDGRNRVTATPGGRTKPPLVASLLPGTGRRSSCWDLESSRWDALPAASREAEDVARSWRRLRTGEPVLHLDGARATELAVKVSAPGSRVVHLATHGFFAGEDCEPAADDAARGMSVGLGEPRPSRALVVENPLLHSGLALAGANRRGSAGPDEQDGVLTAEEVATLDLSACEWAVLSACGTGVGTVQAGEGVMGLQRAFALAGAGTVVMSLWSVDDEAARAWMSELYRARLVRGLDTAECVREASLAVLHDRRGKGLDDSPFWWGAFVASGDWR